MMRFTEATLSGLVRTIGYVVKVKVFPFGH